jgi:undecaprenyl-diphosphatase
MDETVTRWINAGAGKCAILDAIVIGIAVAGVPLMVLAIVAQWWGRQHRIHLRHVAIEAALASLAALVLNQLILLFVHRLRPYDAGVSHLIVPASADWSFPSDHATVVFAIAATFALSNERNRAVAFLIAAFVISWSRVFIGTHYLSDVLGGGVIGIGVAIVVTTLYPKGSRIDRWLTGLF